MYLIDSSSVSTPQSQQNTSTHSAQPSPPRQSTNLFGLPGMAPGMVSGGNQTASPNRSSTIPPVQLPRADPSQNNNTRSASTTLAVDPASEREKRLRAIERRLGSSAVGAPAPGPPAASPARPNPSPASGGDHSGPSGDERAAAVLDGLQALLAANGFRPPCAAAAGAASAAPCRWRGRGSFELRYGVRGPAPPPAASGGGGAGGGGGGTPGVLTLKGIEARRPRPARPHLPSLSRASPSLRAPRAPAFPAPLASPSLPYPPPPLNPLSPCILRPSLPSSVSTYPPPFLLRARHSIPLHPPPPRKPRA